MTSKEDIELGLDCLLEFDPVAFVLIAPNGPTAARATWSRLSLGEFLELQINTLEMYFRCPAQEDAFSRDRFAIENGLRLEKHVDSAMSRP